MDMFDFGQIAEFFRLNGHGYVQSGLLFMIWWTSRGIRRDLFDYKTKTDSKLEIHEKKLNDHEVRIIRLET